MNGKEATGEAAFLPYQKDCIRIVRKASASKDKILLSIAAGFGRSVFIIQALKALLATKSIKRALLIYPRNVALHVFSKVPSQYSTPEIKLALSREYSGDRSLEEMTTVTIVFFSLDDIGRLPGELPGDLFDVVFVDECDILTDDQWAVVRGFRTAVVGTTSVNPSLVGSRVLCALSLEKPTYSYGTWLLQLKDVADVFLGASYSLTDISDKGQWKFIRPRDVRSNQILKVESYVSKNVAERYPKSILAPGDILLQNVIIFDFDETAVVTIGDLPAIASNDFFIIRLRTLKSGFLVDYLRSKTVRKLFITRIEELAHGATLKHLSLADAQGMPIPLMPSCEFLYDIFKTGTNRIDDETNIDVLKKARNNLGQLLLAYRESSKLEAERLSIGEFSTGVQSGEILLTYMGELFEKFDNAIRTLEEMKTNDIEDTACSSEVTINKGQTNRAENAMEKWLELLTGDAIAELDFIDKTTFGYFDSVPKDCGLRIITSVVKDPDKCVIEAENCARGRPYLEIVKINKIHQRWIGSEKSFFIDIGTDLKRDALGNSTYTMRKLPPVTFKQSISHFESLWGSSQEELRRKHGRDWEKATFFSSRSVGAE